MDFDRKMLLLTVITLLILQVRYCSSVESDFTVEIDAGRRECFYQDIKRGSSFELEYQVIEGGDLDINFVIQAPSGRVLITEVRKTDAVHRLEATEEGDYQFCMDNTFSRFSSKVIFFEIVTDDPDPSWNMDHFELVPEDLGTYEMKLEDFRPVFDRIKEHLDKSQQSQNKLRSFEARDRNIVEMNFERVNLWSAIQLGVMITVSVIQVYMIRSLFEEKSKMRQLLKMKT